MTSRTFDLAAMKRLALGLLIGAGGVYLAATAVADRHPAWGYVAAFAEAAMIGAIADWFAVVALFRHPLNLPIPHTAIIPANKSRIGENLAGFICANFLATAQVLAKIERFGIAARIADWLAERRHAEQAVRHVGAALHYALGALDDERVRHFFRATVVEQLQQADLARLAGQLVQALTADGRHQALLEALLRKLALIIDDEALKSRIAEAVAAELKVLRIVGLDVAAARYATAKLVAGVAHLAGEMSADPAHPLRAEFDAYVLKLVERLKDEPELRRRFAEVQHELLASPALADYLQGLWGELLGWVRGDLGRDDSLLRERAAAMLQRAGAQLQADAAMQAWIQEQLMTVAPRWIERYREDIRRYIVTRVADWNTEEMTRELERNIGRDLQFIRINGTLVGGLVGLAIHAVTQLLHGI